jgi:hypothetical protein
LNFGKDAAHNAAVIPLIGASGAGVVWGWLLAPRSGGRGGLAPASTLLLAAEALVLAGLLAALLTVAASGAGFAAHATLLRGLRRRVVEGGAGGVGA